MPDPAEMLRIAALLERLVLVSKLPIRRTEAELGLSNGYLARIFSGKIELKYRHILEILEKVGVEPLAFFELAYRDQETQAGSTDLVAQTRNAGLPQLAPLPAFNSPEFERGMIELLLKLKVLKKPPAGHGTGSRPAAKKTARRRPAKPKDEG